MTTDANDALQEALDELSTLGELIGLRLTAGRRCFARFRTMGEPEELEVEIPLLPGFNLSNWVHVHELEQPPPGTVLH